MLKRFGILGFVLLLMGGTVLGWVLNERGAERRRAASCKLKYGSEPDEYLKRYNEWLNMSPQERANTPLQVNGDGQAKTKAQVRDEQAERLNADLDMLATGELDAYPFADVLYGENWQEQVQKYKDRKEQSEFVLTASVVATSIGGVVFGWCLIVWAVRLFIGGASRFEDSCVEDEYGEDAERQEIESWYAEYDSAIPFVRAARASIGADSGRPDSETDDEALETSAKDRKKIPVLISKEKAGKHKEASPSREGQGVSSMAESSGGQKVSQTLLAERQKDAAMLEASLKAHTEKLEKQMGEFRRMRDFHQSTAGQSPPLNGALEELTEQVSAIRDYASNQQQRVEKLQDGYDWNIIRTFCLRVIRCIDNIESRIERCSEEDVDTGHLEEVRDELIFALESSGVEQFSPDVNSLYRGQEKSTEAVKEREHCDGDDKAGRIAKVVRPGYQYFIDEGNRKMVRAAQVKLFG